MRLEKHRTKVQKCLSRITAICAVCLSLSLLLSSPCPAQTRYIRHPIIECYHEPIPVKLGDVISLFYEIHITNITRNELELKKIGIYDSSSDAKIKTYEGEMLNRKTRQFGVERGYEDRLKVRGGFRAVVFVQLDFPAQAKLPAELKHEISYTIPDIENKVADTYSEFFVQISSEQPVVIGAPVGDGTWLVGNTAGDEDGGHRGSFRTHQGRMGDRARFGIDILGTNADGEVFDLKMEQVVAGRVLSSTSPRIKGEKAKSTDLGFRLNENWYGYGAEILAVKDGIVAHLTDNIPENTNPPERSVAMNTYENVGGNSITLNIGNGNYAVYSHLIPGSIRVKAGDRVKKGQVLARLGNSGNSDAPHLHFHIQDSEYGGEGQPFVFEQFELLAIERTKTEIKQGVPRFSLEGKTGETRSLEMPVEGAIVRFAK